MPMYLLGQENLGMTATILGIYMEIIRPPTIVSKKVFDVGRLRNVNFLAMRIIDKHKYRKKNVLDCCRNTLEKGTSAISSVSVFQDILELS